jgi:hypothetical protein
MVAQRHSSMRIFRLCLLASIGCVCAAQPNEPDCSTPLWNEDVLHDLSGTVNLAHPVVVDPNRADIAFVSNDQLIVYEIDEDTGLSSRTSPGVSSAFRIHASVLDATSGKRLFTKDWPTRPSGSSVQPLSGGVLVRTGEILTLYSKDFTEIAKLKLPAIESCKLSVSASQQTAMVNCFDQRKNVSQYNVLEGATLHLTHSWGGSPALYHSYSISDRAIAAAQSNGSEIVLSEFGSHKWDLLWKGAPWAPKSKEGCVIDTPMMIRDDALAFTCQGLLRVLSTAGNAGNCLTRLSRFLERPLTEKSLFLKTRATN